MPLVLSNPSPYIICLRYIMDCEGLSVADVAERTGLGSRTVQALRNNHYKRIGLDTLAALTAGLDVPLDSLLRKSVPERGNSIAVNLGWPDMKLTPNRRPDNAKYYRKLKAQARNDGFLLMKQALNGGRSPFTMDSYIRVVPAVSPPDARRRDEDNLIAGLKHYMDGMAKALGIDDSQFHWDKIRWKKPVKGGVLEITLEEVL